MSSWADAVYAKQFIVGPATALARNMPARVHCGAGLTVGAHAELAVTRWARGDAELVMLGHVMDPRHPQRDNAEVLRHLGECSADFEAFEKETTALGGRWVAIVRLGDQARLYPDATGTKATYHTVVPDGGVWAASSPGLLGEALGFQRDEALWARFQSHNTYASSWPGELTPYAGVRQLLPNHYLDLRSGEVRRFWPRTAIAARPLDEAAALIAERLHGVMAATVARGSTGTPLSGGYDSRTLFACAGELRSAMLYFSIRGLHLPHHDFVLPKRLARMFGARLHIVAPQKYPTEFWQVLQHNVSSMWWDASDYMLYTFGSLGVRFVLHGMISEIARCFYEKNGRPPEQLTGMVLANLGGYLGHPMAVASFSDWLAGTPHIDNLNLLDLFYWEHRVGNWAALQCTGFDMLIDPIAPYNCRELLEVALGVDVAHRRAPHRLHREICRVGAPRTLELPFNTCWRDEVEDRLIRLLPWRVKHAWSQAKMRRAGFG